jgi:hypothetical protein
MSNDIESGKLETLSELKIRMQKENIPIFDPDPGIEQILVVNIPKRILDIDEKMIKYVMLLKTMPDGVLQYTILNEETVNDMFNQAIEMRIKLGKDIDTDIAYS